MSETAYALLQFLVDGIVEVNIAWRVSARDNAVLRIGIVFHNRREDRRPSERQRAQHRRNMQKRFHQPEQARPAALKLPSEKVQDIAATGCQTRRLYLPKLASLMRVEVTQADCLRR